MPDENEIALFRRAMQDVKPLEAKHSRTWESSNRRVSQKIKCKYPGQSSNAVNQDKDLPHVSDSFYVINDTDMQFRRSGIQHKIFKRLVRGEPKPKAVLDLHGLGVNAARDKVIEFLLVCAEKNLKSVMIIHGKGHGSKDGHAVLKPKVNLWLRQLDVVLAFCPAQPKDGGDGAAYILIRGGNGQQSRA